MPSTAKNISLATRQLLQVFESKLSEIEQKSPVVINNLRNEAINSFIEKGVPEFKSEDYKYTRIDRAINNIFETEATSSDTLSAKHIPEVGDITLYFNEGVFDKEHNEMSSLPNGVLIGSLAQLAKSNEKLVEQHLNQLANKTNDSLVNFNTAIMHDGLFVYVPKGIELKQTIRIVNISDNSDSPVVNQRNLIVVEEGAKAQLLFCDYSSENNHSFTNHVSEIYVASKAELDVVTIQNNNGSGLFVNSSFFLLGEEANAHNTVATLNSASTRNNLKVDLQGENAEMTMNGMSILNNSQHLDNFTSISHSKPNCLSNQLYKNVLDGQSTGAFSGQIHVVRDAQKTNAFQRNNNVLLSDEAKMNAKPQLIIDADDVKCSHGATIGQINKDALFYMQARGISKDEAKTMLMNAFCNEVLSEIRNENVRNAIVELSEKKLRNEY